jgi:hypothetical protein
MVLRLPSYNHIILQRDVVRHVRTHSMTSVAAIKYWLAILVDNTPFKNLIDTAMMRWLSSGTIRNSSWSLDSPTKKGEAGEVSPPRDPLHRGGRSSSNPAAQTERRQKNSARSKARALPKGLRAARWPEGPNGTFATRSPRCGICSHAKSPGGWIVVRAALYAREIRIRTSYHRHSRRCVP